MSDGFISIDYVAALKKAQELDLIVDGCDRLLQDLNRQMEILDAAWDGDAAEAFQDKLAECREKTKNTCSELESTISAIRQVVAAIKEADEAAALAASMMPGDGLGSGFQGPNYRLK